MTFGIDSGNTASVEEALSSDLVISGQQLWAEIEQKLIKPQDKVSRTTIANKQAVKNWLTKYQPKPNASNLERVRGYLEAFHHLNTINAWEIASDILSLSLDTPTRSHLHTQLGIWGYYQEQIDVYQQLMGKLTDKTGYIWNSICLSGIGNAYQSLGDLQQALYYHQQHLGLATIVRDRDGEGIALGNLGLIYDLLGDYLMAIECHEQSLKIAQAN